MYPRKIELTYKMTRTLQEVKHNKQSTIKNTPNYNSLCACSDFKISVLNYCAVYMLEAGFSLILGIPIQKFK